MIWCLSHRADPEAKKLADRHYNRQKPESSQFVPPGRCVVLLSECKRAFWVTSAPFSEFVKHEWAGAWICSAFRNEGAGIASELIKQAVSATIWVLGEPPELGIVTFIDRSKVRPTTVRGKKIWGWTYAKAGFRYCGETKGGLIAMQMRPEKMPLPAAPQQRSYSELPLFRVA